MNKFNDDTFLARWLNDELSDEELREFKASKEFDHYQRILAGSQAIRPADVDEEKLLDRIKKPRGVGRPIIPANRLWAYGIAASVAVLCGVFLFNLVFESGTVEATGYGETKTLQLPDGSEVILNARSELSYSEGSWDQQREVSLEGEAFFKVMKGSRFTVKTRAGEISVLGTQFNVQLLPDFFEVICYEGKVKVSSGEEFLLARGNGIRKVDKRPVFQFAVDEPAPSWLAEETTFRSVPVKFVLIALENQYHVQFEGELADNDLTFTGSFPHDNLALALKIVLGSLQIDYQLKGDNTVVLRP